MATKVITIPGFLTLYDTDNFGGTLFASPNVRISGPSGGWDGSLSNASATTDMNAMYDLIITHVGTVDQLVVAGHSRGAQVIYKLFRERMADLVTNVNPAKMLFISSGNPERYYGGASVNNYAADTPAYPGTQPYGNGYGLPSGGSGIFRLLDISRQYDRWADHPDRQTTRAMDNIDVDNIHSAYEDTPHLGVDGYPVDWNEWARHDMGNTSYLTCSTYPLPLGSPPVPALSFLARLYGGALVTSRDRSYAWVDDVNRADIEASYIRPVPIKIPYAM